jgi:hypothetical protein
MILFTFRGIDIHSGDVLEHVDEYGKISFQPINTKLDINQAIGAVKYGICFRIVRGDVPILHRENVE